MSTVKLGYDVKIPKFHMLITKRNVTYRGLKIMLSRIYFSAFMIFDSRDATSCVSTENLNRIRKKDAKQVQRKIFKVVTQFLK